MSSVGTTVYFMGTDLAPNSSVVHCDMSLFAVSVGFPSRFVGWDEDSIGSMLLFFDALALVAFVSNCIDASPGRRVPRTTDPRVHPRARIPNHPNRQPDTPPHPHPSSVAHNSTPSIHQIQ
ncbi:hypothetical protein DL93DRAFT_576320 [Clavulina sp. PMI_390]|nr:hypothetical protein DL93DRAFT_576320 [Clavulina sp. PMI_390]